MEKKILAGLAAGFVIFGMAAGAKAIPINVTEGKTVITDGVFFTGGWGGGQVVSFDTIVDGAFVAQGSQWDQGPVWWDDNMSPGNSITIDLGGVFIIESFVVQADDNDAYILEFWDANSSDWVMAWDIPNFDAYGWGMLTRPDYQDESIRYMLPSSIITTQLRFFGNAADGDRLFAVSEIQAYGTAAPVPEPSTMFLFGIGLVGLARMRKIKTV